MKLHVEILFTKIEKEQVSYYRDFFDLSYKSKDPDIYVRKAVEQHAKLLQADPKESIIHSTSWRCDHDNLIVLTYIVYSDKLSLPSKQSKQIALSQLKIATSEDINKPKPIEIAEKNIVSHGLRHISFLIKNDPVFKEKLKPDTKNSFKKIDMILAGKVRN